MERILEKKIGRQDTSSCSFLCVLPHDFFSLHPFHSRECPYIIHLLVTGWLVRFHLHQNRKGTLGINRHFLSNTSRDKVATVTAADARDAANIVAQRIVVRGRENQLLPLYEQVMLYKESNTVHSCFE